MFVFICICFVKPTPPPPSNFIVNQPFGPTNLPKPKTGKAAPVWFTTLIIIPDVPHGSLPTFVGKHIVSRAGQSAKNWEGFQNEKKPSGGSRKPSRLQQNVFWQMCTHRSAKMTNSSEAFPLQIRTKTWTETSFVCHTSAAGSGKRSVSKFLILRFWKPSRCFL